MTMHLTSSASPARVAREIVNTGNYERAKQQLEMVDAAILKAIQNGKKETGGEGWLDDAVINAVRAKGYNVTTGSHRNEDQWSVTW